MSNGNIKRCPICKRNKERAIKEQVKNGEPCGVRGCVFKDEIKKALDKKRNIKIVKKPRKKIQIIKKTQKDITVIQK